MKNWKTTLAGLAAIIGGISLFVNHPERIEEAFTAVSLGVGLIFAKDKNVTGGTTKQGILGTDRPKER